MKRKMNLLMTAIVMLLIAPSCSKEDGMRDEMAKINLSISNMTTRGAVIPTDTNDPKITKIRVIVFADHAVSANRVFGESELSKLQIAARVGKDRDVYVIANEASAISSELDRVILRKDLDRIMQPQSTDSDFEKMYLGEAHNVEIKGTGGSSVGINLIRAYAKLTLNIKKGGRAADDDIEITKVVIGRNNSRASLFPSEKITKSDQVRTLQSAIKIDNGSSKSVISEDNPIYLYENVFTDSTGRAPLITVYARYNGATVTYTANINAEGSVGTDAGKYTIQRNHHYLLNATISKIGSFDGMAMETEVADWVPVSSDITVYNPFIVAYNGQELNKTTDQEGLSEDHPIILEQNATFQFTIKIKGPEEINTKKPGPSKWKVMLTDGNNFEIVEGATGLADGKTPTTIKVRAKSQAAAMSRKMALFFTVNGQLVKDKETSTDTFYIYFKQNTY